MARKFDLIVFDWDGTVMDSTATIVDSVRSAARDLGIPVPSIQRSRHIIGLGLIDAMRHAMPDLEEHRYAEVADRYRHHYLSRDHELQLFDGIADLIESLSDAGHFLAVATGKSRRGLDRAFETSGLRARFHASRCADECHSKPHPQMLEELMAEFGVSRANTVMIGDTTHDIQMAHNAGVLAIGVAYGAHPRHELEAAKPAYCANDVSELARWLESHA